MPDIANTTVGRFANRLAGGRFKLDGKTYAADPAMCMIADAGGERPIGLGGVMGGESTGCSDETTDVFIECAWFDPKRLPDG